VGKGRMAGVFRARHTTGQHVAIKVLPTSAAKNTLLLQRFHREAKLLTKLDSPFIVRSFQDGEAAGKHYFVMEFLDGETLEEVLQRRGKLSISETVSLAKQCFKGLQHLADKGMIHRDLKPANIMLMIPKSDRLEAAHLKILDIGLGKEFFTGEAADALSGEQATVLQLTSEGTLLGTPDYISPEQARNAASVDIRTDMYSLGCIIYRCLTGETLFHDTNVMNLIVRHATEAPPPLSAKLPNAPPGLQPILDLLLAKDPAKRFATPQLALDALRQFHQPTSEQGGPPATPSPKYMQWLATAESDIVADRIPSPSAVLEQTDDLPAIAMHSKEDLGVELVPLGETETQPRKLLDLNRRDLLMLTFGATGAIGCISAAYLASRAMKKSP
jgi:eukaryotic-like serine/threonine-protein kinase